MTAHTSSGWFIAPAPAGRVSNASGSVKHVSQAISYILTLRSGYPRVPSSSGFTVGGFSAMVRAPSRPVHVVYASTPGRRAVLDSHTYDLGYRRPTASNR